MSKFGVLPPWVVLDPLLRGWLLKKKILVEVIALQIAFIPEDATPGQAKWVAKAPGIIAGLPVAARVFEFLNPEVSFVSLADEGARCEPLRVIAEINGSLDALLMGERVALNLAMRLSGIATSHIHM